MRVTELQVKGLFGVFDHEIPLRSQERVTIIHGPNGFGKTMILRMLAALVEGDARIFERIPFSEFRVLFEDGSYGIIRHREESKAKESRAQSKLVASLVDPSGKVTSTSSYPVVLDVPAHVLDRVDRYVPGNFLRFENGWRDASSGKLFSLPDILKRIPSAVAAVPRRFRPRHFAEISRDLQVFFVETKRLDAERSFQRSPTDDRMIEYYSRAAEAPASIPLRVEQYSRDILQRIKTALADYAKHSQESDRTFPERLVRFVRENQTSLQGREILERMDELENKRQRLISLGFLDSETGLRDLTEEDVRRASEALTIYVGDVQEKLAVFDDLARRVGKFMDILNERFKYKRITINRELGFRVETHAGEAIQLEDLSSGEQHELVVLYELLFRAPRSGLVLVDEPEISLHVAWQSRFLSDLIEILGLTDSYALVATHSPVVIGTRWDLAVELKGPAETNRESDL